MSEAGTVDVEITKQSGDDNKTEDVWHATVNDRGRSRAWSGTGSTPDAATTEAVRGFLGDRRSSEYVGKS
jgi:hypothetical protein